MKKVIGLILSAVLVFSQVSVMALNTELSNVVLTYDVPTETVNISGDITSAHRTHKFIIFVSTKSYLEVSSEEYQSSIVYVTQPSDSGITDNKFKLSFQIGGYDKLPTGKYYVSVGGSNIDKTWIDSFDYTNQLEIQAINAANSWELKKLAETYGSLLNIDVNDTGYRTNLPAAARYFENERQSFGTFTTSKQVAEVYAKAVTMAELTKCAKADSLKKYYDVLGISAIDKTGTFKTSAEEKNELERLLSVNKLSGDTLASVLDDLAENLIIAQVNKAPREGYINVLKTYNDKLNLDLSLIAKKGINEIEFAKQMKLNSYNSISEIEKAYSDSVSKLSQNTSGTPSGGGSSGGGYVSRGKDSSSVSYVPQSEAEQTESYTDVPKTHWAYKSIQELTELGVVCGTGNGNFEPYRNVTRAEFVKMLMTALKTEIAENVCTLTDVNTGDWYYGYVSTAQKIGMVTGDDNGHFNPNETISRQDMAVMVKRALDAKGIVLQKNKNVQFSDADDIADYAKEAVAVLAGAGLLNGVDNGMFAPLSYADRAQAAKCISNMLQLAE